MTDSRVDGLLRKIIKSLIKAGVLLIVFIVTIFVASKIMNKDRENMTVELESASYPVMNMVKGDISYNELHGYANRQVISCLDEDITLLGEKRETGYHIDLYGRTISSLAFEVRNEDGSELIENGDITDYVKSTDSVDGTLYIKDLIDTDKEYSLTFILSDDTDEIIYFYTKIIWSEGMNFEDKTAFITEFHNKLFDRNEAADLKKYLETDSSLNDNSTFADVDIHSSFKQITYGDLNPVQLEEPQIELRDISESMETMRVRFIVCSGEGDDRVYYLAEESYRVKLGTERMYLIDYERKMEQMPDRGSLCINDKIVLGIRDSEVDYEVSEDGNTVAFVSAGRLYSYGAGANKLTEVFAFYGDGDFDKRVMYDAHSIRILDIEESGTIEFAVYGYMNSGRHEGEIGIEVYRFDDKLNTIEELAYIPYEKSYGMLEAEMDSLLYLNRQQHLFLTLENKVYCVDLESRSVTVRNDVENDDTLSASSDHRILISTKLYENSEFAGSLVLTNLKNETDISIQAMDGDAIKSLGFVGDDVIYGIAHMYNIKTDTSGRTVFPMYQVVICDETGNLIKCYEYDGYYVTDVEFRDNQLVLERATIDDNGNIRDADPDYITITDTASVSSITDATTVVDIYETYVQLQLPDTVDSETLKTVIPKEVVYEGGREVSINLEEADRYYVYDAFGLENIYNLASNAVEAASEKSGWVYDDDGVLIWKKINKKSKNQIMAIEEEGITDDKNSLSVCLDAMLKYEGIIRNSNYLLGQGESVLEILGENLEGYRVLDLKGCQLDSILYYVSSDIPVLVITGDGTAKLITGYNDSAVVVLEPEKGTLTKIPTEEAENLFEGCGNEYITYVEN